MKPAAPCPVCRHEGHYAYTAQPSAASGTDSARRFEYYRCDHCALLYQHPMPAADEIAAFYPDDYSVYAPPTRTTFSGRELIALKEQLGYRHLAAATAGSRRGFRRGAKPVPTATPWVPGGRLLDVGCGNGEYLLRMQSAGWQCQGVEFSARGVEVCRQHGLEVFHGSLLEAGFASDAFDLVTAHHFIEHVPDPAAVMAEMVRVTRPGGRILIRTPNNAALGRRWFGRYWFADGVPDHVLLFSERSLEYLARHQGLALEQRFRPVEHKLILKSLALKRGRPGARYGRLAKWLAKLYIPLARLAGQGDELFDIYVKPA